MLTEEEEKFLSYWEKNREKEKSPLKHLWIGLPLALLICIGVILNYISGWYTRAMMVANGGSTPLVLIFAFILIIVFCTVFFKQHRWEMNEQRYIELSYKKKSQNSSTTMQQDDQINSQVSN
jgi:membrane protein YdbS with pleckstrin-like domain